MALEYIVLAIAAFFILAFIFRKYVGALFLDYIVDGLLSFADNLIGVGALGLDIGDFVAAYIIFTSEKKRLPFFVAFFVAWEATNFFPLGLIPVFGEGIELFLGFFPAVTLARIFFNSEDIAKQKIHTLKNEIADATKLGISLPHGTEKTFRELETLSKEDPNKAISSISQFETKIRRTLTQNIQSLISDVEAVISDITSSNVEADDESITFLEGEIEQAEQLLDSATTFLHHQRFREAFYSAKAARQRIEQAVQQFDANADYEDQEQY